MTQPSDLDRPEPDATQAYSARYGRRPAAQGRRAGMVGLGVLVVVLVGWVVWATVGQSRDSVAALVQSYHVTSPHQVAVTVQITRSSTAAVHCTVSAIATDHSQVGETVVGLPAGSSGTRAVSVTVKTERTATSVDVGDCR